MELIQALKKFGFTQQESLMYVTLCKMGAMTGYEAAKVSGISRSNAYAALSSLVEKGGAIVSSEDSSKYTAIPREELILNLRRSCESTLEFLEENLPEQEEEEAPYLTISGYGNTLDKMRNMILLAKGWVYLSVSSSTVKLLTSDLENCIERGLKVVILSDEDPHLSGAVFMHNEAPAENVRIIADTSEVIVGTLEVNKGQCLYSKNKHLVSLMREALLNEIELIKIRGI
ncbi:TrmB family transcriptional regulator [Halodesulfovibrio spirochaetisodalis]|uniref:Transcriptional regulator for lysine biosynthesis and transport n=1 Tax=Halodesulfovibrio spirochaetisodalis TaxID=1560234 RepID=A0A1B7XAT2_9BACT|nr:TrmB family transcriptional regulator [Halodesulfovibrio spirochaetisodalis]OBQ46446.1 transcriptional regulator for lysine biosynthesis and transport [Halodesulfovibrio spirochaetisodalis]